MRITTQMLANSAAKSGIPIQRTSLLDIINNKSSQNLLGTIGKSMNTTSTGATDILRKNNYAKLEDLSENGMDPRALLAGIKSMQNTQSPEPQGQYGTSQRA